MKIKGITSLSRNEDKKVDKLFKVTRSFVVKKNNLFETISKDSEITLISENVNGCILSFNGKLFTSTKDIFSKNTKEIKSELLFEETKEEIREIVNDEINKTEESNVSTPINPTGFLEEEKQKIAIKPHPEEKSGDVTDSVSKELNESINEAESQKVADLFKIKKTEKGFQYDTKETSLVNKQKTLGDKLKSVASEVDPKILAGIQQTTSKVKSALDFEVPKHFNENEETNLDLDKSILDFIEKEKNETEQFKYRPKILFGTEVVIKETTNGTPIEKISIGDWDTAVKVAEILNKNSKVTEEIYPIGAQIPGSINGQGTPVAPTSTTVGSGDKFQSTKKDKKIEEDGPFGSKTIEPNKKEKKKINEEEVTEIKYVESPTMNDIYVKKLLDSLKSLKGMNKRFNFVYSGDVLTIPNISVLSEHNQSVIKTLANKAGFILSVEEVSEIAVQTKKIEPINKQIFKKGDSVTYKGASGPFTIENDIDYSSNFPLIELDNGHSFRWNGDGYYSSDLGLYLEHFKINEDTKLSPPLQFKCIQEGVIQTVNTEARSAEVKVGDILTATSENDYFYFGTLLIKGMFQHDSGLSGQTVDNTPKSSKGIIVALRKDDVNGTNDFFAQFKPLNVEENIISNDPETTSIPEGDSLILSYENFNKKNTTKLEESKNINEISNEKLAIKYLKGEFAKDDKFTGEFDIRNPKIFNGIKSLIKKNAEKIKKELNDNGEKWYNDEDKNAFNILDKGFSHILYNDNYEEEKIEEKLTPEAQEFISKKIAKLMDEGYEQRQAVAIAYNYAREAGYKVPQNPNKEEKVEEVVAKPEIDQTLKTAVKGYPDKIIRIEDFEVGQEYWDGLSTEERKSLLDSNKDLKIEISEESLNRNWNTLSEDEKKEIVMAFNDKLRKSLNEALHQIPLDDYSKLKIGDQIEKDGNLMTHTQDGSEIIVIDRGLALINNSKNRVELIVQPIIGNEKEKITLRIDDLKEILKNIK